MTIFVAVLAGATLGMVLVMAAWLGRIHSRLGTTFEMVSDIWHGTVSLEERENRIERWRKEINDDGHTRGEEFTLRSRVRREMQNHDG